MALTRKNFLFLGSDEGGHRAAIFYTVIESARLNDLDPEAYMADVIDCQGRPDQPACRAAALELEVGAERESAATPHRLITAKG